MNWKTLSIVVIIAFAVCWCLSQSNSSTAAQGGAQEPAQKWEYMGIGAENSQGADSAAKNLNRWGDEGWEVCGTLSSTGEYPAMILLKRRK